MNVFRKNKRTAINLDHASTTPVLPQVRAHMDALHDAGIGSPGGLHQRAQKSREVLADARRTIAEVLHGRPEEVIFTSGATESNNLALQGAVAAFRTAHPGVTPEVVISAIEHTSLFAITDQLRATGTRVHVVPVDAGGRVDPEDVKQYINEHTAIVSILAVSNEIGIRQPIREIGTIIRQFRRHITQSTYPYFHTDASAGVISKCPSVTDLRVDMLTISSMKVYGPRGIGCLYKKQDVAITPLFFGGGQEYGLRPGTVSVIAASGFAYALEHIKSHAATYTTQLQARQTQLLETLATNHPSCVVHGDADTRVPEICALTIPGIESEYIIMALDTQGIYAAAKSACLYDSSDPFYILTALYGDDRYQREGSIRFSFGIDTTKADIAKTTACITHSIKRNASWEARVAEIDF